MSRNERLDGAEVAGDDGRRLSPRYEDWGDGIKTVNLMNEQDIRTCADEGALSSDGARADVMYCGE